MIGAVTLLTVADSAKTSANAVGSELPANSVWRPLSSCEAARLATLV